MYHKHFLCVVSFKCTILILFILQAGFAGTIRHDDLDGNPLNDPDDYLYLLHAEDYPSVGRVVSSSSETGSGVLIAPNYVLTATHLVNEVNAYELYFQPQGDLSLIQVTTKYVLPFYFTHLFGDMAILRLSETILTIAPSELYDGDSEIGRQCTIVGFGRTGTGVTGSIINDGDKRAGDNILEGPNPVNGYLMADFDNPDFIEECNLEYCFAPGDSGGGVFIYDGDVVKLAGINSYIQPNVNENQVGAYYGTSMNFVRVSAFRTWINSIISRGILDWYENDDISSDGTPIYNNTIQNHSISPANDIDWLMFFVNVESEVVIETAGTSGDTRMWLKDSELFHVEYDDNDGVDLFSRIDRMCGVDPLPPGDYYIKIDSKDNNHEVPNYNITLMITPCGSGNHNPQLTNGYVNPGSGTTSTNFYWSVDYYDADGDAAATKNVYIDGIVHETSLFSGSPSNGTYRFGPLTLSTADHNYYFYFTDGNGGSKRLPSGSSSINGPQVSSGGTVYFGDANLKAAVEDRLDITNPTPADMLNLTGLDARYENITDLTGLEYAANLSWLNVGHNQIADLSPLSGLTNLTSLSVYYNEITDIAALSGLSNLTDLNLYWNQNLADISPVLSMTNLSVLDFGVTHVSSLSPLSELINLAELRFRATYVSDISALSGLMNLRVIECEINQISDISSLAGMHHLTRLIISSNPLNSDAYCTYIPLLIANNPGMYIEYDANPDPGAECPVSFYDSNLKAAVELALGISDPMPSDMLALVNFNASYRGITDLTGLEHSTNLSLLNLNGNLISNISPLCGLLNLMELNLYGNQINDISSLSGLTNLTSLNLNGNQISDISCLFELPNLTNLKLGGNQICDISPLRGLANLTYVDLYSNPLNTAAYCTYIPLILSHNPGIDFDYDPKQINMLDFSIFAEQWLMTNCGICEGSDLDQDRDVDLDDLLILVGNWLGETTIPEVENMIFIDIPGGSFQMGDSFSEGGLDELPVHTVMLDSFHIGKYEVTNQQYCDFLNSALAQGLITVTSNIVYKADSGTGYPYCDTHASSTYSQIDFLGGAFSVCTKSGRNMVNDPMVKVSWYGAVAFCNWLSQQEGKEPCYDLSTWECDFNKSGYRLPTEAQWEYAARGGLSGKRFPWGDTITHTYANYYSSDSYGYDISSTRGYHPIWNDDVLPYTSPVGFFDGNLKYKSDYNWAGGLTFYQTTSGANGYGLYDMAGNVWEWCDDWYLNTYYSSSPLTNPAGPTTGSSRVLRGGNWDNNHPSYCRVASRGYPLVPTSRSDYLGFRLALMDE